MRCGAHITAPQDASPGVSHPCLDQGCLWPLVNGAHQKKEETSQGWPEVAGFYPGSIRRSLACGSTGKQGGSAVSTSCHQLPAPSFTHSDPSTPSPLPLGVPIGCPKKSALLTKKISIASFSSFFFFFEILQIYFFIQISSLALSLHHSST